MIRSILVLAGCVLLVGLGVVLPTIGSIRTIRTSIVATQTLMEQQYQQQQTLRETTANLQTVKNVEKAASGYAIREGEELRFIQSLENIAAKNRLVQTIQLETANQKDLSAWEKVVPLTIVLKGSFRDVLRYLRDTEVLPYYLQLDAIRLQGSPTGALDVRINGRVHWLADSSPDFVWGN